ncbi:MAG: CinA family protein [Rhodospirillaceae bacterium]|nr:CinA family protein [Rhodospirillaceae bacterium]
MAQTLGKAAEEVIDGFRRVGWRLALAESCTGGLIAGQLTEVPGASDVVERGFVVYSNAAKVELLGVPPEVLERFGAVSAETAAAMAEGALARAHAEVALAVTGIAGPGGGSPAKPVGLVFFGLAHRGAPARTERHVFAGDRRAVRTASVARALDLLRDAARAAGPVAV